MRGSIFRCGSLRLGWHRATRLATSWKRPGESRGYASEKDHDDEDHWLAKYFPNQEEWILKQAEAWWHKGLGDLMRSDQRFSANAELILDTVRSRYEEVYSRNQGVLTDSRSRTHLQQAALAVSTYKTLKPWLGDQGEAIEILGKLMGAESTAILDPIQKVAMFMSRDKFAMVSRRLRLLKLDYGKSFDIDFEENGGGDACTLTVNRCFYASPGGIFDRESCPELAAATCCSIDKLWFEGCLDKNGNIKFSRQSAIAGGDKACVLRLEKTE